MTKVIGSSEFKIHDQNGNEVMVVIRQIDSSNIQWIGWPKSGEPIMFVEFTSGARYGYLGVTRQKAVAGTHYPESVGSWLAKEIKPKYEVVRIR